MKAKDKFQFLKCSDLSEAVWQNSRVGIPNGHLDRGHGTFWKVACLDGKPSKAGESGLSQILGAHQAWTRECNMVCVFH